MTPKEAEGFYEEDEDPAGVFARFDAAPHVVTARPGYSTIEQIRHVLDYIRSRYGPEAGQTRLHGPPPQSAAGVRLGGR